MPGAIGFHSVACILYSLQAAFLKAPSYCLIVCCMVYTKKDIRFQVLDGESMEAFPVKLLAVCAWLIIQDISIFPSGMSRRIIEYLIQTKINIKELKRTGFDTEFAGDAIFRNKF